MSQRIDRKLPSFIGDAIAIYPKRWRDLSTPAIFAASRSINTATRFAPDSGGIIIEIIGRAAYIPNVYYNGDESEYLFHVMQGFV